ncbi:MAG: DUF4270 domain-containing protein [Odoribacter sp.]|nr:DUF4270 domain-containing protein [Odoribacter sp.]MDY3032762.1 DUF4270 family protein [Odoribacter sp.]
MKRICLGLIGALFLIYACNNDLKTIGQDMVVNGNYIEEMEIPVASVATVRLDSFITSMGRYGNSSNVISKLIVGKYQDVETPPQGGITTATPCFQITPASYPKIAANAVLDSTTFHISYAGNMWGDTIFERKEQILRLYQLKKLPEFDYERGGFFYNNTPIELDSCIAENKLIPTVSGINNSYFRIDDTLAYDLFERIRYKRTDDIYEMSNSSEFAFLKFLEYFKGLAIVPDSNNTCLFSIKAKADSLYLQFNYRENTTIKKLRFPLAQLNMQFNLFDTDRQGTPFESLEDDTCTVSLDKAEKAITQGLAGYMVKLELPKVPKNQVYSTIIKAQMEVNVQYIEKLPLGFPPYITVYTTDELNRITGRLANNSDSPVNGLLQINQTNPNKSMFVFDMTEYYQRQSINSTSQKGQQVLLSVPYMNLSYDQMIVTETPVVRFYYANYKQ